MSRWRVLCIVVLFVHRSLGQTSPAVIGLGEAGHGRTAINARKAALLDSLAREAPVAGIVFESSFTGAVAAFLADRRPSDAMRGYVYPFWLTDTILRSVERVEQGAKRAGLPFLWGCDVQEDCRYRTTTQHLLALPALLPWRSELLGCDSVLERYMGEGATTRVMSPEDRIRARSLYARIAEQLEATADGDVRWRLVAMALRNRAWLCDLLALERTQERMQLRDSLMAANTLWVREVVDNAPVILWAADLHVRHVPGPARWCGERLRAVLGDAYQAVSVRERRGSTKGFDRIERVRSEGRLPPEQWRTPCPE